MADFLDGLVGQARGFMQLGTLIPQRDVGGSPSALREFAQAAESLGYDFLEATDHVLGPNAASRLPSTVMK